MSQKANINSNMITWARNRATLSLYELAQKLNISEEKLALFEDGIEKPTFNQATDIANKLHIPFGYLFLQTPPEEVYLPDLRTINSNQLNEKDMSLELKDTIKICISRKEWFKDYLLEQGINSNPAVGRCSHCTNAKIIANDIKAYLNLPFTPPKGTPEQYLNTLIEAIENKNILVMSNGIVGNNTHRKLSIQEFRGFAICDPIAPLIFINAADGPQPKLFTLIHELAHIWTGIEGISDASPQTHLNSEKLCNAVAGEFLVPEEAFQTTWDHRDNLESNIANTASQFKVSKWVAARRALSLHKITQEDYKHYIQKLEDNTATSGGGNFWNTQPQRLSKKFIHAVSAEALSGRMLIREAARLLNSKPNNIKQLYEMVTQCT